MHPTHRLAIWSMLSVLTVVGVACGSQEQLESTPTDGPTASRSPGRRDETPSVTVDESGSSDRTVTSDSRAPATSDHASVDGPETSDYTGSGSSAGSTPKGKSGSNTGSTNGGGTGGGNTATTAKPQSITFAPIPPGWVYGSSLPVIAVASSNLPVSLSAAGACQVVNAAIGLMQATDVGECRVTASQGGGNGYAPATPVTRSAQIAKAKPTIGNFGGGTFEHPRTAFSIPLTATASGGATVHYRVLPDGYDDPLCAVSGKALAIARVFGLPRNCVVEAYVDASSQFEAAVAQATFVINPTVVVFTGASGPNVGATSASVTVTLNRAWNIEHGSSCGLTSASPEGGANSYTVTVVYDEFVLDPGRERPVPCDLEVRTSAPDGAVTTDVRLFNFDVA
jgi:hypothetical protein